MCLPTGSLANQMSSVLLSASLAGWLACFLACSAVLVVSPMVDQVETLRKRGMKKKEEKKRWSSHLRAVSLASNLSLCTDSVFLVILKPCSHLMLSTSLLCQKG